MIVYIEIAVLGVLLIATGGFARRVLNENKELRRICAQQALEIDRVIKLAIESQKLVKLVREHMEGGQA